MLDGLGHGSLDELVAAAVPSGIRDDELDLPPAIDEAGMLAELRALADRNQPRKALIGLGYHGTITPAVIRRNVLENPAWYTAYTPYQPEISQGRLEALLAFQTVITELTGLPLANASLLDEATAAAEGMTLTHRLVRDDARNRFIVHADTHPQTLAVIATRAEPLGLELTVTEDINAALGADCFGVLLSYPGSSGELHDLAPLASAAHDAGARVVVAADPLAMCLLPAPAALGADVVVGSAQRFGVPMFFGGPHAGFLAAADDANRPAATAPTWSSRTVNRSAFRPPSGGPISVFSPLAATTCITCPGGWSEPPSIGTVGPRIAWRCRHASNTSVASARPATSAQPRCCSPTLRPSGRSTTGPTGCGRSPRRSI